MPPRALRVAVVALGVLALLVVGGLLLAHGGSTAPPGAAPATATAPGTTAAPVTAAARGCAVVSDRVPGAVESRLAVRPLCALPGEAATVYVTIRDGGRLRYDRDGVVFANAERLLPAHPRGYYHEYTVPTPGSADRGARRLVTGDARELYYTGDHYASFVVVDAAAVGP